MKNLLAAFAAIGCLSTSGTPLLAEPAGITVEVDKPGIKVSPLLYGVFFEEINRSGDGGIYAEMIQNRSFEDAPAPNAWKLIQQNGAEGSISLDKSTPLNPNNPTALKIQITSVPNGGRVGVSNEGFKGLKWNKKWGTSPFQTNQPPAEYAAAFVQAAEKSTNGLCIEKGKEYRLSLYLRCQGEFQQPLGVTLEKQDGTLLASGKMEGLGTEWKKYEIALTASDSDSNAQLVLSASVPCTLFLDMVSLFPAETFKGRANGIRKDLGQMIADLKPAFMRFPGGCYVEGDYMAEAFRWKKTIGDIAERPGHWCRWGYYCTHGLGYHEYLQFCEDIGAEPLFVVNCGMAHKDHIPMEKLEEYIQDALDAIEYANGPVESKWGALRAKAGHPEPFHLKMIEIGNENGGTLYDERYGRFYDAIKAKYPEIKTIAALYRGITMPESRPIELLDEHYYNTPEFFMREAGRYDRYDRKGKYQVYCGEYAVTQKCGMGNQLAALGEAAFMTGMERNSDVVRMSSYAPLLVCPEWRAWNPNAIVFDSSRAYGTPSYHAQALFAANWADQLVQMTVKSPALPAPTEGGLIGLGMFASQAEFKDIKITRGKKTLYAWNPASGLTDWKTFDGTWTVRDGALCQTGTGDFMHLLLSQPLDSRNYTLTLKARKLGGNEGVRILFQNNLQQEFWERTCWNVGGWNNSKHVLQGSDFGDQNVAGQLENGKWYELRIEVQPDSVTCSLDGKRIQKVTLPKVETLYATAGRSEGGEELILKVVNVSGEPVKTPITFKGAKQLAPTAKAIVMAGEPMEENSFQSPAKIVPKTETITGVTPKFQHTFPAHSISVLRFKVAADVRRL